MSNAFNRLMDLMGQLQRECAREEEAARVLRGKMAWYYHELGFCDRARCLYCEECPGHERGGKKEPCCERAGQHDGSGGGEYPPAFVCPKNCPCHD